MQADLFSDIAEAKEAKQFSSSYKEAKRCKAYDSFEILASLIDIERSLPRLLESIWERLELASQHKMRVKLSRMLQHASKGIIMNKTATSKSISEMFYGIVKPILTSDEEIRKLQKADRSAQDEDNESQKSTPLQSYMMVEFAISTLFTCIKKKVISVQDEGSRDSLNLILPLLVEALASRSSGVVSVTLQCLNLIIQSDQGSLNLAVGQIGEKIIRLLKRCPNALHPIAQESFRALTTLIRGYYGYKPKENDLRFLVQWSFTDLESSVGEKQAAFTLLRGILSQKLMVPEVYDVMGNVQELMVKSQYSQIRQLSSACLLQFLLDYPLGAKRLEQHLQFLIVNLNYEHESGRRASLDMIATVIAKFPVNVLSTWSDKLFLPLVAGVLNEQVPSMREQIASASVLLIRKVPDSARKRLLSYLAQWIRESEESQTQLAGLTMLVSLVSGHESSIVSPGFIAKDVLPYIVNGILSALGDNDWQRGYQCLLFVENILSSPVYDEMTGKHIFSGPLSEDCWKAVRSCLLHDHFWIRKSAARVIGSGLGKNHTSVIGMEGNHTSLSFSFVKQLEADVIDDDMAAQAVKCLVYVSPMVDASDENVVHEIVRRLTKLADNTSYTKTIQRNYALRFIAAFVSRLGSEKSIPYLPMLLRPCYRILEPGGPPPPEDIKTLAEEVFSHTKSIVGSDNLLQAYNKAREDVNKIRQERRTAVAVQTQVDPEAAAKRKLRVAARKSRSKKKAMEEVRRLRSVGVRVPKNRRDR